MESNPTARAANCINKALGAESIIRTGRSKSTDTGKTQSVYYPLAKLGPGNSARMVAQSSVFTKMHVSCIAVEDVPGDNDAKHGHVWKIIIPVNAKLAISRGLDILGFNEFLLFPELETLAGQTRGLFK